MASNVPEFKNVRYKRLLDPDDEKGITPFVVVTEEVNSHILWRVTSQAERILVRHGDRDCMIDIAALGPPFA